MGYWHKATARWIEDDDMGQFGHGMGDEETHDALRKAGEDLRKAAVKLEESTAARDDLPIVPRSKTAKFRRELRADITKMVKDAIARGGSESQLADELYNYVQAFAEMTEEILQGKAAKDPDIKRAFEKLSEMRSEGLGAEELKERERYRNRATAGASARSDFSPVGRTDDYGVNYVAKPWRGHQTAKLDPRQFGPTYGEVSDRATIELLLKKAREKESIEIATIIAYDNAMLLEKERDTSTWVGLCPHERYLWRSLFNNAFQAARVQRNSVLDQKSSGVRPPKIIGEFSMVAQRFGTMSDAEFESALDDARAVIEAKVV